MIPAASEGALNSLAAAALSQAASGGSGGGGSPPPARYRRLNYCPRFACTAAISSALRDVIDATQKQTQVILDKMCQQEIDALKERNLELQNRVNMQNLAASQTAQTAALIADNTAQTQYIVNRVAPYPIPSYTVANPNTPAA